MLIIRLFSFFFIRITTQFVLEIFKKIIWQTSFSLVVCIAMVVGCSIFTITNYFKLHNAIWNIVCSTSNTPVLLRNFPRWPSGYVLSIKKRKNQANNKMLKLGIYNYDLPMSTIKINDWPFPCFPDVAYYFVSYYCYYMAMALGDTGVMGSYS